MSHVCDLFQRFKKLTLQLINHKDKYYIKTVTECERVKEKP